MVFPIRFSQMVFPIRGDEGVATDEPHREPTAADQLGALVLAEAVA
jgi:hypothetical protein